MSDKTHIGEVNHTIDKPTTLVVGTSFVGAFLAFLTTSCCILPMVLVLSGLGGAWLAIFSPIVAASLFILPLALLAVVVAWVVALRRGSSRQTFIWLSTSSVLTVLAVLIFIYQEPLNTYLVSLM